MVAYFVWVGAWVPRTPVVGHLGTVVPGVRLPRSRPARRWRASPAASLPTGTSTGFPAVPGQRPRLGSTAAPSKGGHLAGTERRAAGRRPRKRNRCAARRLVVYPTQLGGIVERSLGPMAHLEPKGKGNSSLPGNRRLGPGVWDDAPGDPCDMAKARLPEPQSSADALYIHRKDACNRCPSCVVRVGSATHSSRRGAMPSEGI